MGVQGGSGRAENKCAGGRWGEELTRLKNRYVSVMAASMDSSAHQTSLRAFKPGWGAESHVPRIVWSGPKNQKVSKITPQVTSINSLNVTMGVQAGSGDTRDKGTLEVGKDGTQRDLRIDQ